MKINEIKAQLNEFYRIFNAGYEKELIKNLIDIINLRNNQKNLIDECYKEYFFNLSLTLSINDNPHKYKVNLDPFESDNYKNLLIDFKNLLALVTVIDIYEDKDLVFTNLIDQLNSFIKIEIERKNTSLIKLEKNWEELKKIIKDFGTQTKEEIVFHKTKILVYKLQLEKRINKLNNFNEFNPN